MGELVSQFTVDAQCDGSGLRDGEGDIDGARRQDPWVVTFCGLGHHVADCGDLTGIAEGGMVRVNADQDDMRGIAT